MLATYQLQLSRQSLKYILRCVKHKSVCSPWSSQSTPPVTGVRSQRCALKVVVVLVNGGAVDVTGAEHDPCVGAIIEAWRGGEEAGTALARLLWGDVDFSAALPFSLVEPPAEEAPRSWRDPVAPPA